MSPRLLTCVLSVASLLLAAQASAQPVGSLPEEAVGSAEADSAETVNGTEDVEAAEGADSVADQNPTEEPDPDVETEAVSEPEVPTDDELARYCRAGDGEVCYQLALNARDGLNGTTQDTNLAEHYFRFACERGWNPGCVGWAEINSPEPPRTAPDARDAVEWRTACRNGVAEACFTLGDAFRTGYAGMPIDEIMAETYLREGCELGEGRACAALE